ncbi:hypothetical protein ACP70R_016999 [Stipagrostis hirtigluma subsp. patula]
MEMRNNMKTSLSAAAVAEEEARHLLGVGPAVGSPEPGAAAKAPKARRPRRTSSRRSCGWPSFAAFAREEPDPIPVGKPLNAQQLKQLREERFRATRLGHFEKLAINRRFVMKCLKYYNSMHPSDECEPAPGEVIKYFGSRDGIPVTHGNFVARRKRSGCFSFLPAPWTLFFVELMWKDGRERVVKCTPLAMNRLQKATVYLVSVFGGALAVMAAVIAFARPATVALNLGCMKI